MCWIVQALGAAMTITGVYVIVRFFMGRGANRPVNASIARVEIMILGVLMVSVGLFLFILGLMDAICRSLGIA